MARYCGTKHNQLDENGESLCWCHILYSSPEPMTNNDLDGWYVSLPPKDPAIHIWNVSKEEIESLLEQRTREIIEDIPDAVGAEGVYQNGEIRNANGESLKQQLRLKHLTPTGNLDQ